MKTLDRPFVFTPSPFQQAIFDAAEDASGHIQIRAVAGSGKTTTLIEMLKRWPLHIQARTLMCAFNREIRDAMEKRAPTDVTVKTIHGLGYGMLARHLSRGSARWNPKIDDKKYERLVEHYWTQYYRPVESAPQEEEEFVPKVLHFVRVTLTDYQDKEAILKMCAEREIDLPEGKSALDRLISAIPTIIEWGAHGIETPLEDGTDFSPATYIDYDDMIWLPIHLGLPTRRYERVLVDECQDLSAAQLATVLKCLSPEGMLIAVGDPRQAIYAFAGADAGAFDAIREQTQAQLMPLDVCYRCPKRVIALAQTIVPEIQYTENAPDGVVETIEDKNFLQMVDRADMVLCRTNAPLITAAFQLIINGKPAKVRGRDIGKNLIRCIDSIEKMHDSAFATFQDAVERWRILQFQAALGKSNEEAMIQSAHDRADCLRALHQGACLLGASSFGDLRSYAERLFTDTKNGSILLSTIHKAKGLEADRVWILRPDLIPHPMAKTDAAKEQETNLAYVAYTRAQKELFLVTPQKREDETVAG